MLFQSHILHWYSNQLHINQMDKYSKYNFQKQKSFRQLALNELNPVIGLCNIPSAE